MSIIPQKTWGEGNVYEYLLELKAPGQNLFPGVTIKPGIMEQLKKLAKLPLGKMVACLC